MSEPTQHSKDCTIYNSLINFAPEDGICTCGYGWNLVRKGDWSQMYSEELLASKGIIRLKGQKFTGLSHENQSY